MKARKRDSNDEWKDVIYAQLEGETIWHKGRWLEFQHDNLSTELKTYDQVNEEKHWQDVKERTAIAAMQGLLSNHIYGDNVARKSKENNIETTNEIVADAVNIADALVKQLQEKDYGSHR